MVLVMDWTVPSCAIHVYDGKPQADGGERPTGAATTAKVPIDGGADCRSNRVGVSRLDEVGERDAWRCWLCDEPVDQNRSVNDDRGPSVDNLTTKAKAQAKASALGLERLAHRICNTKKGANAPVVRWSEELFVVDPAPILNTVERLQRKAGREVMARCPTKADAATAATWLADRLSRLCPELALTTDVEAGGGQYLLILRSR